jgi:hypothetical protein
MKIFPSAGQGFDWKYPAYNRCNANFICCWSAGIFLNLASDILVYNLNGYTISVGMSNKYDNSHFPCSINL